MKEKREKEKRRLIAINAEISLLEREKKMDSNAMIEIENAKEIQKRARIKKKREELKKRRETTHDHSRQQITPILIKSLNQLIYEMNNLPLVYVLSQSSKMVLTEEWNLSIVERECLRKFNKVKDLINQKMFLEEKNIHLFTEVELQRRKILKRTREQKSKIQRIANIIAGRLPACNLDVDNEENNREATCSLSSEEKSANNEEILARKYRYVLGLFSLMKSNKSSVRYTVPQSKKTTVMHSSHSTCLEKIKTEPGKINTIPELVKYRHTILEVDRYTFMQGMTKGASISKPVQPAYEKSEDLSLQDASTIEDMMI